MSRTTAAVLAIAAGTLWVGVSAPTAQQPPVPLTTGRITGVVISEGGGEGSPSVNRALVTLSGTDLKRGVLSDGEGRFSFDGLPEGAYSLFVEKPAFVRSAYGALRAGGDGTPIVVRRGETVDIRLRLLRGAVITGTILAADGEPAANVLVMACDPANPNCYVRSSVTTLTDDRGMYRLFGLSPGDYLVRAVPSLTSPSGMRVMSTDEVDAELSELRRRYAAGRTSLTPPAPTPRVPDWTTGASSYSYGPVVYPATVTVAVGEERSGVDFSLVLAGTTAITGQVLEERGNPALGVHVVAVRRESGAAPLGLRPSTATSRAPDGRFTIVNVTPGSYLVQARTQRRDVTPIVVDHWASESVGVVASAVSGLTLRLQPALTVTGRIAIDGASSVDKDVATTRLVLRPRVGSPQGMSAAILPSPGLVRPDGTFVVEGVTPGDYQLEVTPPRGGSAAGLWVRSAMLRNRDLLDEPLVIDQASSVIAGVEVHLSGRHSSISGTLDDLAAAPAPSYVVVVLAADAQLRQSPRRVRSTRPDTQGRFLFQSLPPGSYLLAVLGDDVTPETLQASDVLNELAARGVPVTVGEGEQKTQNVRLAK